MPISQARRVIYGAALVTAVLGTLQLFNGVGLVTVSMPVPFNFVRIGVPGSGLPTAPSDC